MQSKDHWEKVYSTKDSDTVSWFQAHADMSMRLIHSSGLPVMRYAPDALHAEFGDAFTLLSHEEQLHHTPFGSDQQFIYCMYRMIQP